VSPQQEDRRSDYVQYSTVQRRSRFVSGGVDGLVVFLVQVERGRGFEVLREGFEGSRKGWFGE
jgi:hypothetical protein